jgi:hypothetical protein
MSSGCEIETYGGTGERQPTPDGVAVKTAPLNGPRTMAFDGDASKAGTIHHLAGTGDKAMRGMVGRPALPGSRVPRDWPMGAAGSMWPTLRAT